MTTQQNRMKVLNDNLKRVNALYSSIAQLIYERVTDCWSDEEANKLDAQIAAQAGEMVEKLRVSHSMATSLAIPPEQARK